jgi:hypothetical protein
MLRDEDFEDKRSEEEKQEESREKDLIYKRAGKRWRPFFIIISIQSIIIMIFPESWMSASLVEEFTGFMASLLPAINRLAVNASNPLLIRTSYSFIFFMALLNVMLCVKAFMNVHKEEPIDTIRYHSYFLFFLTLFYIGCYNDLLFNIGDTVVKPLSSHNQINFTNNRMAIATRGVIAIGMGFSFSISFIPYLLFICFHSLKKRVLH